MASQAQALLAVIAGSTRRKAVYWRESVLRSSLYGIPDKDGISSALIQLQNSNLFTVLVEEVSSSVISLGEISLRSSLYRHDEFEAVTSSVIGLSIIELRSSLLKYDKDLDILSANTLSLGAISLTKVLIKHVEPDTHQASAGVIKLSSISLIVG